MTRLLSLSAPLLLLATPAFAQDAAPPLPEAAAAMIDAAIANGDADDVQAVFNAARAAFPESAAQIDARWQTYQAAQAQRAAAAAAAQQEVIRQAGLFENWSGEGQIGGFQSSGNTDEIGVSTALSLNRDGINWQHRLRFAADYRRQDGTTTREQLLAQYEPRYQIDEGLFAFESSFIVTYCSADVRRTEVFATGAYHDLVRFETGELKFMKRQAVVDNHIVNRYLVFPL